MMNAWIVRPYPHLVPRAKDFIAKKVIALGWPNIGDLTDLSREELLSRICENWPDWTENKCSRSASTLLRFRDTMQLGDLVIMAPKTSESRSVSIGRISGEYFYNPRYEGSAIGYPHQRPVTWLRHDVARAQLPKAVIKSLKSRGTMCQTDAAVLGEFCREQGWL